MHLRPVRITTLASAFLLSTSASYALEGKALFDKFVEQNMLNGTEITWQSLQEDGADSFTVLKMKIVSKSKQTSQIGFLTVRGLQETDTGLITVDTLSLGEFNAQTSTKGNVQAKGITLTDASVPHGVFAKRISKQTRKRRVKFGNFIINGLEIKDKQAELSLEALALVNGDIPLDYRYQTGLEAGETVPAPLTLDMFAITKMGFVQNGTTSQIQGVSLHDLNVPTSTAVPVTDWMKVYSRLNISKVKVALGDTTVFSMDNFGATLAPPDTAGNYRSTGKMDGIKINLKAVPDPKTQQIIDQLGYAELNGTVNTDASYNPETGRVDLADFSIGFQDAMTMAMTYTLTGYTAQTAQRLNDAQMKMAQGQSQEEALEAVMAELAGVKLEGLTFSLTDRSLTGRLLDFQAKQMGTTGEQLAASAPLLIGMGMGQLQMPEFTSMITEAASKFLKEKGTISARVKPQEPLSLLNIFNASKADPKQIPRLLNLQITAE